MQQLKILTVYQKQHNLPLILSGAVLLWLGDGRSTRWQVLSLSQLCPDPNPRVFVSRGKLGGRIPRGRAELKEGSGPRRRRGSFDMQRFVSAAGSAETKVKLPSRNNWWPFYSVFHKSPPVDPQLSSQSLTPRGANRTVNYEKNKKLKLKITSDRSSGYFFRTSSPQPHPTRYATGGLTGGWIRIHL